VKDIVCLRASQHEQYRSVASCTVQYRIVQDSTVEYSRVCFIISITPEILLKLSHMIQSCPAELKPYKTTPNDTNQ
jgi:hypothetical protein